MQLGQELVGPGGGLQPPGQVVHHVPVQELLAQPQPAGRPHQVLLVRVESEVELEVSTVLFIEELSTREILQ